MVYNYSCFWGYGSVGRAPRSQRGGQRFESAYLHQKKETASAVSFFMPISQGFGYHSRHRRVIISRQRDYHFRFCEFVMIIHRVQMIASVAYMIVCKATVITRSARIISPTPPWR